MQVFTLRMLTPDSTLTENDAVFRIKPHASLKLNDSTTTHNIIKIAVLCIAWIDKLMYSSNKKFAL